MLGPTSEIQAGDDSNLEASLTVSCGLEGTYSKDIESYTCTPPCPFPSNPEPEIIEHDWTDNTTKPEIYQTVR